MIAVALTSTASLVLGKVLEIMMDSVLQREKRVAYLEGFDVARSGIY